MARPGPAEFWGALASCTRPTTWRLHEDGKLRTAAGQSPGDVVYGALWPWRCADGDPWSRALLAAEDARTHWRSYDPDVRAALLQACGVTHRDDRLRHQTVSADPDRS